MLKIDIKLKQDVESVEIAADLTLNHDVASANNTVEKKHKKVVGSAWIAEIKKSLLEIQTFTIS